MTIEIKVSDEVYRKILECHKITGNIRKDIDKETVEFLMNLESYFLIKPYLTKEEICHNEGSKNCVKCEEPDCDSARGRRRKEEGRKMTKKCDIKGCKRKATIFTKDFALCKIHHAKEC